ncbi:MAG: hypothetical protein AAGF50_14975 [Pseudomonadota bacterium]
MRLFLILFQTVLLSLVAIFGAHSAGKNTPANTAVPFEDSPDG